MPTGKEREHKQRMKWADMQRRGHFRYVMEQTFIMIGLMASVQVVLHFLGKTVGWSYPLDTLVDTVGIGFIAGFLPAELNWSDMRRKFRIPPPEEDWVAK